jgi:hypothetical protein
MWANRILAIGLLIFSPVVAPLMVVSLLVLKILHSVTLGLLLFPIYLVWHMFFLGPLLGLSWIWGKVPFLRVPLAVVGIPLAIIAETYCCLTIGDSYVRIPKLCLCPRGRTRSTAFAPCDADTLPKTQGSRRFSTTSSRTTCIAHILLNPHRSVAP